MDSDVVTGLFTIGGVIVGGAFAHYAEFSKRRHDERKARHQAKRDAYIELLLSLQCFANVDTHENLTRFQNSINVAQLIGSAKVVGVLIPYYRAINREDETLIGMDQQEIDDFHCVCQDALFRAIREELGESDEGLPPMYVYGIRPRAAKTSIIA